MATTHAIMETVSQCFSVLASSDSNNHASDNVLLFSVWGLKKQNKLEKKWTQLENIICFRKGDITWPILELTLSRGELSQRVWKYGLWHSFFFSLLLSVMCFLGTKQTVYLLSQIMTACRFKVSQCNFYQNVPVVKFSFIFSFLNDPTCETYILV